MFRAQINSNEQRIAIAKLRKTAETIPNTRLEHERLRKNKTRTVESNTYRLITGGEVVVVVMTGTVGLAVWSGNLTARLRGNR
jgi:hypothetical protein